MPDYDTTQDCLICAKHRGIGPLVGPVVHADELVIVSHRILGPGSGIVPGYLFIEPRRHVASLAHLTWPETTAIAHAAWCGSRALDAELAPRHVFSLIAGRTVAHLHQHLFIRPPAMPDHFAWHDVDSWPDRPLMDADELAALCTRLSTWFGAHH
ncbi:HIT family protein [Nocardia sp. NPDC058176]|uniref:HIT family protein n=1 Tax=Nocardia sp. NPDC058176 TaxID=3346368 RepID=UPI0036DF774F